MCYIKATCHDLQLLGREKMSLTCCSGFSWGQSDMHLQCQVQVWDTVGHAVVETGKGSGKTKNPNRAEVFLPLAMAVVPTSKAYQKTP